MKRLTFLFWVTLPLAVVNVITSLLLVKYTQLGVIGVVIPTVILGFLRRPVVAAYAARVVNMPVRDYFIGGYGRPMILMILLSAIAFGMLHFWPVGNVLVLGTQLAVMCACWAALCWTIGFDAVDRSRFQGLLQALRRRIGGRSRKGVCRQCGYSLQGLAEPRCPECGTAVQGAEAS
jgi:uncharacterized paraquat-inducible protein A